MKSISMEALRSGGRIELGASSWESITREDVQDFGRKTGDTYEIHMEPDKARAHGFKDVVAHGYLVLSHAPAHYRQLVSISDRRMGLNYGIEKLRFISPVCAGDQIRFRAAICDGRRKGDGVVYGLDVAVEVQGQEAPALVAMLVFYAK